LFPWSNSGTVRLIGDDPVALAELWDEVRSAGRVELPRLDSRSYGDFNLTVGRAGIVPIGGPTEIATHYSYEISNGRLRAASALGPDVDFIVEVVGRDEYRCETVERVSVLEAMDGPTN
jgi:hypothetical protein